MLNPMNFTTTLNDLSQKVSRLHRPEAHEIYDRAILDAEECIRLLKTARNAHCAISTLPAEILLLILVECGTYCNPKRTGTWSHFINITMVCKAWRATTLSSETFWGHLPTLPYKHFPELLNRSGQSPLRVKLMLSNWRLSYPHALFSASRLQDLQLSLGKSALEDVFARMAGPTGIRLPLLQRLQVVTLWHFGARDFPALVIRNPEEMATLPSGFLECCPVLKYLDLDGLNIPWMTIQPKGPATFAKLVSLKLGSAIAQCPPQQWIHSVLISCPLLRELEIPLPKNFQSLPHNSRQTFPSLTILKISTHSFGECVQFMTSITLPQLCSVSLIVFEPWDCSAAESAALTRTLFSTPHFSRCSSYPHAAHCCLTVGPEAPSPQIHHIQLFTDAGSILFDIRCWLAPLCPSVLSFFTLPQLTKLRVDLPEISTFTPHTEWHTFISKHGAGIRQLELANSDLETLRICLGVTAAIPDDWRSLTDGRRWWENKPIAKQWNFPCLERLVLRYFSLDKHPIHREDDAGTVRNYQENWLLLLDHLAAARQAVKERNVKLVVELRSLCRQRDEADEEADVDEWEEHSDFEEREEDPCVNEIKASLRSAAFREKHQLTWDGKLTWL